MKTELQTNQHLIQEFLGVDKTERLIPYHSCWNNLMPVVEKIEQICEGVPQQLLHLSLFSTRQEIYQAVVQFIKYYNQNK